MRKPLAKAQATAPVRGLGAAIKPRPFQSRGLAQVTTTLAPLPASEPSKPPCTLRLRPAELSHMKGTIHPNPPAQHLPFQGEAGRGCESPDFSVQPLPCSPPRRSTVPFECIDWRRSFPKHCASLGLDPRATAGASNISTWAQVLRVEPKGSPAGKWNKNVRTEHRRWSQKTSPLQRCKNLCSRGDRAGLSG